MLNGFRKSASLSGAAVLLALAAVFMAATTFRLDVQYWNDVCGARVRTYDPSYAAQLTATGFSGKMPSLVEAFLALAIPSLLTRSQRAHRANVTLMILLMFLLGLAALSVSPQDYYDECYRGGHENRPGDVGWIILPSMALIVSLNLCLLAADWMTWLVQVTSRLSRKVK